jgi:hypothetical protein
MTHVLLEIVGHPVEFVLVKLFDRLSAYHAAKLQNSKESQWNGLVG